MNTHFLSVWFIKLEHREENKDKVDQRNGYILMAGFVGLILASQISKIQGTPLNTTEQGLILLGAIGWLSALIAAVYTFPSTEKY